MSGFVKHAMTVKNASLDNIGVVMTGFSPERVPALSTLAQEFAIFDAYHASLPGPTTPNRVFFNSGASDGVVDDNDLIIAVGFKGKTMFDFFEEHGITWKTYFEDISDLWYMDNLRNVSSIDHFHDWDTFKKDAADGNLANYTWLSPRFYPDFGHQARDQHPDHDVVEGERAIAEVYEALRNGKKWDRTALLITYDEHGGIYDHVSPPDPVPNPDGINAWDSKYPFNFTRGGLRVCSVLVSPWVKKGLVVHGPNVSSPLERISNEIDEPTAEPPVYEHTSMFKTLRNIFGFPNEPLTKRQAWAAPYDWVLATEEQPRTDCPTSIPVPAAHTEERFKAVHAEMRKKRPNGLQRGFYRMVESLHGRDGSDEGRFQTQEEMGEYVKAEHAKYLARGKARMSVAADPVGHRRHVKNGKH
jgi:phospholipase C